MSRDGRRRQHSHDSGFHNDDSKYVTVVSVNGGLIDDRKPEELIPEADFVTVLSIGDVDGADRSICLNIQHESGFVEEVSVVERRVGQKLGFGLKFDGGSEGGFVRRLFIQVFRSLSRILLQLFHDLIATLSRLFDQLIFTSISSKNCPNWSIFGLSFDVGICLFFFMIVCFKFERGSMNWWNLEFDRANKIVESNETTGQFPWKTLNSVNFNQN